MKLFLSGIGLIIFGLLLPSSRTDTIVPAGSDLNIVLRNAGPDDVFILQSGEYPGGGN